MAIVKIKLEKGECIHDVKERLSKALSDDIVNLSKESYNDPLMEGLMEEAEKDFSKIYLSMMKEIVGILKDEV